MQRERTEVANMKWNTTVATHGDSYVARRSFVAFHVCGHCTSKFAFGFPTARVSANVYRIA